MSAFKKFHPDKTPVEEMHSNVVVVKERVIDNTSVARLCRVNDIKVQYPYIVEVVRKYNSEDSINYKFQDFNTQQEAERFLSKII